MSCCVEGGMTWNEYRMHPANIPARQVFCFAWFSLAHTYVTCNYILCVQIFTIFYNVTYRMYMPIIHYIRYNNDCTYFHIFPHISTFYHEPHNHGTTRGSSTSQGPCPNPGRAVVEVPPSSRLATQSGKRPPGVQPVTNMGSIWGQLRCKKRI